jgi:hypothetical protein
MTNKSTIWVVGPGRSGTSVTISLLHRLGWKTKADGAEYGPLVHLNKKIYEHVYGDASYLALPRNLDPIPESIIQEMKEFEFPEAVKDPYHSATLGHWIEHAPEQLPDFVVFLFRDPAQCGFSWHAINYTSGTAAARHRMQQMRRCYPKLNALGKKYFEFTYPNFLIDNSEFRAALKIMNPALTDEKIEDVILNVVKRGDIHEHYFDAEGNVRKRPVLVEERK